MNRMPSPSQPIKTGPGASLELLPVIVVDSREQLPLTFPNLQSVRGTLRSADYSILGAEETFGIERKSVADLANSCIGPNRQRFERELHRLRGFAFARLLIIGLPEDVAAHRYYSAAAPLAVLHSVWAFEIRYQIPVVWEPTVEAAAGLIERWAKFYAREVLKTSNGLLHASQKHEQPSLL